MFGLVMSIIVAVPAAFPTGSGAGFTCDSDPSAACAPASAAEDDVPEADGPQYATEAVIDCPTPDLAVIGECDGTVRDTSYRASRDPESERLPGSLRPA